MKRLLILIVGGVFLPFICLAQNGESPISYKGLGIQLSTISSNGDASSSVTSSVASFNGFGSFIDNPAVMALAKGSYYTIGWISQNNSQTDNYLSTSSNSDYLNANFGNLGLVYKIPTKQGSFVIGGGYNLTTNVHYESFLDARNNSNTITDVFKQQESNYSDIAFDAFAVDFKNNTGNELESIFRIGLSENEYRGIDQFANINQNRSGGEISLFLATEFQKNFFAGISLGVHTGSIKYARNFQEVDTNNDYNDGVIPAEGSNPATDIQSIELIDNIDSDFYGFSIRGGAAYKVLPFLNLGASVALPIKINVTEDFFSEVFTEFDDGTNTGSDNFFEGSFDYSVTRPAEYKVGVSLEDIAGFTFSTSVEYINYGQTQVDLTESSISDPVEEANLRDNENLINSQIDSEYLEVINFKGSAVYRLTDMVQLKGGYAFYPSKRSGLNNDRSVYMVGISVPVSENISIDLSGQYNIQNDRSIVYDYTDSSGNLIENTIDHELKVLNILGGVKFHF